MFFLPLGCSRGDRRGFVLDERTSKSRIRSGDRTSKIWAGPRHRRRGRGRGRGRGFVRAHERRGFERVDLELFYLLLLNFDVRCLRLMWIFSKWKKIRAKCHTSLPREG